MTPPRTFPLVADLLNAAAERGRGDYIVFTNVDISPQPFLYRVLDDLMRRDPSRAVIVNRRTIAKVTADPSQISLAYQQTGKSHHGHDCFVFPRAWVPKLILNDVCIGAPWWDYALLANLDALSGFRMFTYLHQRLTFHLGDDRAWTSLSEYDVFNQQQVLRVIEALEQRHGKPPIDSRFAWVAQRTRQQPASQRSLAIKIKRKMRALHELGVLARARGMAKGSSFYAGTEQVPPGPPQPMTAAG